MNTRRYLDALHYSIDGNFHLGLKSKSTDPKDVALFEGAAGRWGRRQQTDNGEGGDDKDEPPLVLRSTTAVVQVAATMSRARTAQRDE